MTIPYKERSAFGQGWIDQEGGPESKNKRNPYNPDTQPFLFAQYIDGQEKYLVYIERKRREESRRKGIK